MINALLRGTLTYLSELSAELRRLGVSVAALSEVRETGSGWVSGCVYTYYGSSRPQKHLKGVVVAVADRLVSMVTEVTPVNERIMRLRITTTLDVIFLVSLYAPPVVSEFPVPNPDSGGLVSRRGITCPSWGISLQPLALTEVAMNHVLVLTAMDEETKASQCSVTLQKVGG